MFQSPKQRPYPRRAENILQPRPSDLSFFSYFFRVFLCLILFFTSPMSYAQDLQVLRGENAKSCAVFFSNESQKHPSMGKKLLESNSAADFEKLLQTHPELQKELAQPGHIVVSAVSYEKAIETEKEFQQVLKRNELESHIHLHVFPVPEKKIRKSVLGLLQTAKERLRYFLPSKKLDYESPLKQEVVSGLISSAMIEVPTMVYLFKTLPLMDASLTVSTHLAILTAYAVFNKAMVNWLLRSISSTELFLKQMSLSIPFILNYNIFGQMSPLTHYLKTNSWHKAAEDFPQWGLSFLSSQSVTVLLQTLFYSIVITQGIKRWPQIQTEPHQYEKARSLSNYLATPILAMDAVFLAMASGASSSLLQMGPLVVNQGHLALIGATALGSVFWWKPEILNPTLRFFPHKVVEKE